MTLFEKLDYEEAIYIGGIEDAKSLRGAYICASKSRQFDGSYEEFAKKCVRSKISDEINSNLRMNTGEDTGINLSNKGIVVDDLDNSLTHYYETGEILANVGAGSVNIAELQTASGINLPNLLEVAASVIEK